MSLARYFSHPLFRDEFFGPSFSKSFNELQRTFDELEKIPSSEVVQWKPRCDASETEKDFLISAELPGVKKEDISVEHEGQSIKISGQKTDVREKKDATYHYTERSSGSFSRVFTLPRNADLEKINAEYTNGVLHVTIPKRAVEEEKAKKKITIN